MKILYLLLLSPLFSFGQNADWKYLQGKIDSAIKCNGTIHLTSRRYTIDKPLVAAVFEGNEYKQVFFKLIGTSTMWDTGEGTTIKATFKDAPILSIQKGKGVIIQGIYFDGSYKPPGLSMKEFYKLEYENYGDPTCRDSRYSPYAAICIDPFSGKMPADGGYPGLTKYYRGPQTRSGSTGCRFEDLTFDHVTVGFISSPNGYTQNAELITLQNIRIGNCKAGIAGCQAQEKLNRIINLGAWGVTHTVFAFNKYGAQQGGNWNIDGVNVAGQVRQLIYRSTAGWFPMFLNHVYAESIFQIGYWWTQVGDAMTEFSIDFAYPEELGYLPDAHLTGGGVTLSKGSLRYYGKDYPIIFKGYKVQQTGIADFPLDNVRFNEYLNIPNNYYEGRMYSLNTKQNPEDYANIKMGSTIRNPQNKRYGYVVDNSNTFIGWVMMKQDSVLYRSQSLVDGLRCKIVFR